MKSFLEFWHQINEQVPMTANPATAQNPVMKPAVNPAVGQQPAAQQPAVGQKSAAASDQNSANKLLTMLQQNYPQFVASLGQNINDPKFMAFLQAGLDDGMPKDEIVKFKSMSVPCINLKPTQNEIDIDKSLSYPLQKESSATLLSYFNGGTFAPGGAIVTGGNGSFIIDGHHRWSQLYCMNPNAQIQCIDMTSITNPDLALKVTQLAIAATAKKIPVEEVKGKNLLIIDEKSLKEYITNKISTNALQAFQELKNQGSKVENDFQFFLRYLTNFNEQEALQDPQLLEFAQNYIWKNSSTMQQNNQPVAPAAPRSVMPQTDKAPGWDAALKAGEVNWKTECLVLSGLLIQD